MTPIFNADNGVTFLQKKLTSKTCWLFQQKSSITIVLQDSKQACVILQVWLKQFLLKTGHSEHFEGVVQAREFQSITYRKT